MDQAAADRLDALLRGLAAGSGGRALAAVETGDGAFRWAGAAGTADAAGRPLRTDTPFFIASVTKPWIATLALKLHEQRRIALDAPLTEYLPAALTAGLHRRRGIDRTDAITVRNLLAHTSGLPDYLMEAPRGGRSLMDRLIEADRAWDVAEVAAIVRALGPHFPPQPASAKRQRARYSDTNYQLLIAVLEAAAGRTYPDLLDTMLLRPLGLRHTWHPAVGRPDGVPAPAALRDGARELALPRALSSAGDLYSTLDDCLRFLRALVSGTVFDDAATWQTMTGRWNRFGLPRERASLRAPGWPIEYALGLMRFRLPRPFSPLRAMPAVIGHTGSNGAWLFHCPAADLVLCGTVDDLSAGAVPYRFVPRLLREMTPMIARRTTAAGAAAQSRV